MIAVLMVPTKLATLGYLKINVVWNKGYHVIIFVSNLINNISSCDSNYIADMVMWSKFGNSCVSMRKIIITKVGSNSIT